MKRKKKNSTAELENELELGLEEAQQPENTEPEEAGESSGKGRRERARQSKKPRRKKAGGLGIALIIIAVMLVALAGGGLYAGYSISNSPYILPNVYVGNINIGGLDAAQATAELEAQWKPRTEATLTVSSIGGAECSVDPVKSGMVLNVDEAVEKAYTYGRDGNIGDSLIIYVKNIFGPVNINAMYASADNEYLDLCIDKLISGVEQYMGEEEYIVNFETAQLTLKKGWGEIAFDREALRAAIVTALNAGDRQLHYTELSKPLTCPDFKAIHTEYDKEPRDASYSEDGRFEVIDEVIGCKFDIAEAEKLWAAAAPGDVVTVALALTLPESTGEELRGRLFRDLLGACTTKYPNSGEERRSNLRLAVSILNEYILYPGETISFNETVGERTEEAGFLPAPAYVDGDVKDEIGGGVCQVSSTLYASTVFAFLETVERECHYFPVNYMQLGTDATVTIPAEGGRSVDFKFKNNKNYPIKIIGYCDNENSTITFEIWGTLEENDYMPIKFDNSWTWQFDYMRDVEPAYEDRAGYIIKLDHETYSFEDAIGAGYRTLTYRIVQDENGNEVARQLLNPKLGNGNYAMDTYYQH